MKIMPMHPEAAYRRALQEFSESYTLVEDTETARLSMEEVFRAGWVASKLNTIEMLDQITSGATNGE